MRREFGNLRIQTFHAITDRLVEFYFVLLGERDERGGSEHLRRRSESKQHLGLHLRFRLDVRQSERLLIDDAIAAHDGDDGAGRVSFFQFLGYELLKLTEIKR